MGYPMRGGIMSLLFYLALFSVTSSANQYDFDEFAETFKDDLKDNEEAHFIYHSLDDGEIKECKDYPKLKLKHINEIWEKVEEKNQAVLREWLELKCYFGTLESAKA
ncbi:MAG: hypothetical protein H2174_08465 [Vampirovibrio sp.]|nr:hypothetical protein [Vampirovibrio sp.]